MNRNQQAAVTQLWQEIRAGSGEFTTQQVGWLYYLYHHPDAEPTIPQYNFLRERLSTVRLTPSEQFSTVMEHEARIKELEQQARDAAHMVAGLRERAIKDDFRIVELTKQVKKLFAHADNMKSFMTTYDEDQIANAVSGLMSRVARLERLEQRDANTQL